MVTIAFLVSLITALGWLFLNYRGLKSDGVPFETKAWMTVAWVIIITVLAFVIERVSK
jgi:hypothetical protein